MKWGRQQRGEHARQKNFLEYKMFNDGGIIFQSPYFGKNNPVTWSYAKQ